MVALEHVHIEDAPQVAAPDGSTVFLLLNVEEGGMAVFKLAPGRVSRPVSHPRVQELWYVVAGEGDMWRRPPGGVGETVPLRPGTCLSIRRDTIFQFRSTGGQPLRVVGATLPPWGGDSDAVVRHGEGAWDPDT